MAAPCGACQTTYLGAVSSRTAGEALRRSACDLLRRADVLCNARDVRLRPAGRRLCVRRLCELRNASGAAGAVGSVCQLPPCQLPSRNPGLQFVQFLRSVRRLFDVLGMLGVRNVSGRGLFVVRWRSLRCASGGRNAGDGRFELCQLQRGTGHCSVGRSESTVDVFQPAMEPADPSTHARPEHTADPADLPQSGAHSGPEGTAPSATYQPIPALPSAVPGVNTGNQSPAYMPRSVRPQDKTAMNRPAGEPGYYLISAAPKFASPAAASAPASIVTLDDSGWRPARD